MYKLILVDDESDVREGILQEINWSSYGFDVAGTAENGKEALELVEKTVPDVVITDIKMPYMDGLELSGLIRQTYPSTRIVILTGFEEFEFAQKAVKLHIDEYVLKPFSSQELANVLEKLQKQMDEEVAEKKNVQKLREHYNESLPILKANFLTLLLTKKQNGAEILGKSKNFDINLDADGFLVSMIRIDKSASSCDFSIGMGSEGGDRQDGDQLLDNMDLALFAVLNITEELIGKYSAGFVFIHNGDLIVLSSCRSMEAETAVMDTLAILEEIRYSIEKFLKLTVTIGVGSVCHSVSEISNSYRDAGLALDYRLILGNNRIIFINDLESRSAKKAVFDEQKEEALACCIKVGNAATVTRIIDTLFADLIESDPYCKECQVYLMEIITAILKIAKDADADLNRIMNTDYNLFADISRFNNIQDARNWTLGICIRIMDHIAVNRQDNCRQLVADAKEFTRNHFHESDITINKVCQHLHISPGYFSTIFKRETKVTYLAYLVQLRMETAKELLRLTALKSFEIAEKVGLSDANYFSSSFKKYTGVSPSEFRSKMKQ